MKRFIENKSKKYYNCDGKYLKHYVRISIVCVADKCHKQKIK